MKVLLYFLFSAIIYAQGFEIVSVTHSVISGYSTYHMSMDRELKASGNKEYLIHNSKWHTLQNIELALSISLGGLSLYNNYDEKIDWLGIAKDALLFMAVRWTVRDGVYNSLNGDNFFHQSNGTTATLEPFGNPFVKLGFLLFAVLFKYLVL